jgi:hypothetical protein
MRLLLGDNIKIKLAGQGTKRTCGSHVRAHGVGEAGLSDRRGEFVGKADGIIEYKAFKGTVTGIYGDRAGCEGGRGVFRELRCAGAWRKWCSLCIEVSFQSECIRPDPGWQ